MKTIINLWSLNRNTESYISTAFSEIIMKRKASSIDHEIDEQKVKSQIKLFFSCYNKKFPFSSSGRK